jgi:hypothetical protein
MEEYEIFRVLYMSVMEIRRRIFRERSRFLDGKDEIHKHLYEVYDYGILWLG